jgi:sigma-B regulation protein RsbU (phosphoserine phosphatase)
VDSFELAHFYTPARLEAVIGGDFYDFISVSDYCHELVIGDVSGKGLQAAVVTALAKYVIRAYAAEDPDPALVLCRANDAVYKYTSPELFITLVTCLLDSRNGEIKYASAGHEPVLIYRKDGGRIEYEQSTGVASGILPAAEYTMKTIILSPGDMMVMYTDGLTDARSPNGAFLGQDGLSALTMELAGSSAKEFLDTLMDRVRDFAGGEFHDDIAVLVIRAGGS